MMKKPPLTSALLLSLTLVIGVGSGSCSTSQVTPEAAPLAVPPAYVQVPHPAGYDISDLRAIMMDPRSPKADEIQKCDADLKKLRTLTVSEPEIAEGTRELIKGDPVRYHWCFYGKLLDLEDTLKADSFVDERQKKALETYAFLVPVSRAFLQEFHDSRYTRWAVKHYRTLSEWVFYRKLELSPQATVDMAEATNPFGFLRDNSTAPRPVLEKYNIAQPDPVAAQGSGAAAGTTATVTPPTAPSPFTPPPSTLPPAVSNTAALPPAQTLPPSVEGASGSLDSLLSPGPEAVRTPASN